VTDDGIEGIQKEIVGWSLDFPRDGGSAGLGRVSPRGTRSGTVRFHPLQRHSLWCCLGKPEDTKRLTSNWAAELCQFSSFFLFPDKGLYYDLNPE